MNEFIQYLISNMQLDFSGDVSLDTMRGYLREDDSREARKLMKKLIEDGCVDDMLLAMADCLRDHLQTGINDKVIADQLSIYADS
ncbi:MAG: hypothetical protein EXR75_08275 [Myxococcales bacterium]|nr:hypothetical protein [Myxococcales bacterium]